MGPDWIIWMKVEGVAENENGRKQGRLYGHANILVPKQLTGNGTWLRWPPRFQRSCEPWAGLRTSNF